MKIALVHEFLVTWGGSDLVAEVFHEMFPEAPIFTALYDRDRMPARFRDYDIRTSFLQKLPGALKKHQHMIPLFPFAFEQFDLTEYDLVLSSHHSSAKSVITRPETPHICFVHSPMRYGWGFFHEYLNRENPGRLVRALLPFVMNYLRLHDYAAAARVDHFVANSHNVARRIEKYYRRESTVIHSPIRGESFCLSEQKEDFYLCMGRLVGYKRVDLAVDAFNQSGRPLVVIGGGPQLEQIREKAKQNVKVLGYMDDRDVVDYLSRAKGFVFPGEEDFGLTPLEAMASGAPVVAFGRGGALETVQDGQTGVFFDELTPEALNRAVERLEEGAWNPEAIRQHAMGVDAAVFKTKMFTLIDQVCDQHRSRMARC